MEYFTIWFLFILYFCAGLITFLFFTPYLLHQFKLLGKSHLNGRDGLIIFLWPVIILFSIIWFLKFFAKFLISQVKYSIEIIWCLIKITAR